jgi:ATP-binding cassette subfamily B (MDR/TAP) protein 1
MAWTTSWVDAAQQPKDRWKTAEDSEISRDPHYTLKRENPAQQPHQALLGALGYGGVENPDKPGESKQQLSFSKDHEGASHIRPKPPSWQPPRPSLFLLFSLTKRDDVFFHLLPCVILGVVSALVTPYMTMVVGDAFEIFATFPLDVSDLQPGQANKFVAGISSCALKLTVAGLIGLGLNTVMVAWWVCLGEKITNDLRTRVYDGVMARPMAWFDLGMGMKAVETEDGEGTTATNAEAIGAGGLMGKFARYVHPHSRAFHLLDAYPCPRPRRRETDDVRIACGRVMGLSIQYFSVFLSCLILALVKSWQLSLVTLSAIPLVLVVSVGTNLLVNPLLLAERRAFAEASTSIERTTNMIGTVKAFNAQKIEADRFSNSIQRAKKSLTAQSAVWGICLGVSNFILLAMFVLGFWYGAKLVRQGKVGVADVMTVFWACLLASQNLQSLVPELVYIQQGKTAMASLMTIVLAPEDGGDLGADRQRHASKGSSLFGDSLSPTSATVLYPVGGRRSYLGSKSKTKEHASLQGIRPTKTTGEFTFSNVSFAYPSRPHIPALHNVSLFLPAGETTFIVGGSGSGKSTIAQLLLRLYEPASGEILLDDRDLVYLDVDYTREVVSAVQQGCIMFDASVHDNVAMGFAGSATRRPQDATRDEIIQACKMAMIDDFIRDLPDGYDTNLGSRGASLSGGQKQRLAIARARLRDPPILILGQSRSSDRGKKLRF